MASNIRSAVQASNRLTVPAKQGKLTGMHYAYDDKSTVVLEIETGKNDISQNIRIPVSQVENFKLGQTVKIETSVVGG